MRIPPRLKAAVWHELGRLSAWSNGRWASRREGEGVSFAPPRGSRRNLRAAAGTAEASTAHGGKQSVAKTPEPCQKPLDIQVGMRCQVKVVINYNIVIGFCMLLLITMILILYYL